MRRHLDDFVADRLLSRLGLQSGDAGSGDALMDAGFFHDVELGDGLAGWIEVVDGVREWYEPGIDGGWARLADGVPVFEPWVPGEYPELDGVAAAEARLGDLVVALIVGRGGEGTVEERLSRAGYFEEGRWRRDERGQLQWCDGESWVVVGADGRPEFIVAGHHQRRGWRG